MLLVSSEKSGTASIVNVHTKPAHVLSAPGGSAVPPGSGKPAVPQL